MELGDTLPGKRDDVTKNRRKTQLIHTAQIKQAQIDKTWETQGKQDKLKQGIHIVKPRLNTQNWNNMEIYKIQNRKNFMKLESTNINRN